MTAKGRKPARNEAPFAPSADSLALSEFEFGLMTLSFGFTRWVEICMAAAQVPGLGALDILVLHAVNHRARGRGQVDICMVLNIDDPHLVSYALKKLVASGLVAVARRGRERLYETTVAGDEACLHYREVRERVLVPALPKAALAPVSEILRSMTALYGQAGRVATAASLSEPKIPPVRTKR